MTENTVQNLGHRFQKGQSGNPAGIPKGARHKTTLLAEKLMQDDVENVVRAVVKAASEGDMAAAKIILDRIAPIRRSATFVLPEFEQWTDMAAMRAAILTAVSEGDIMPGEAVDINKLATLFVRAASGGAPSNELLALAKLRLEAKVE